MNEWKLDPSALHEKLKGTPDVRAVALAQLGARVVAAIDDCRWTGLGQVADQNLAPDSPRRFDVDSLVESVLRDALALGVMP